MKIQLLAVAALVGGMSLAAPGAALRADEPWGQSLLDRDSLVGWDCGPKPVGWTIADSILSGDPQATPLLSGWTFGDVELRFHWRVDAEGTLKLSLPQAPQGSGIDLLLAEGDQDCELRIDGHVAASLRVPTASESHTAALRRAGMGLTVEVDGQRLCTAPVTADARYGLGLAVVRGRASVSQMAAEEPAGWPLVGDDFPAGWWTPGNIASWALEDGEIVCLNNNGNYLRSDQEHANFTLSVEYHIPKRGNSGIGIRTPRAGWPSGDGMELQIEDEPPGTPLTRSSTMAIYGNLPPIARADLSEEWNKVVIKADGPMVSAWVNGVLVQQADTSRLPELRHRHRRGWIGLQDHGAAVRFRNLRLLAAPDGDGLTAWHEPRPDPATWQVLDRLMNPLRLCQSDGITSAAVAASIPDSGRHVLADLTGPGALVRFVASQASGRLAFYFDGEEAPQIDCPTAELAAHVPQLCQDPWPVLTCLAYRKGLRIEVRQAAPGDAWISHVTFPADAPLESFTNEGHSIPRGVLPALLYRHEQLGWGVHREADPLPRASDVARTIGPGERVPLVTVAGAGVAMWLKLAADPAVLDDDRLWLEATVDGEDRPAVAAPARYLFPGLRRAENYPNFATVYRDGFTLMLPIPFSDGLTIAAVNRGPTPLPGIGASVSLAPSAADAGVDPVDGKLRLRGTFWPAAGEQGDLVRLAGQGRLIGLVCEQPPTGGLGVMSLAVDGRSLAGWDRTPAELVFGLPNGDGDIRRSLSGRWAGLAWTWLLLTPVDFRESLGISLVDGVSSGGRLALYYERK